MKFDFTIDFQFDLLKYTVLDNNGYKALELYEDSYFSLVEHSVIAYALKNYYRRKKVVPGKTMLLEELYKVFNHNQFVNNITDDDRKEILDLVEKLFRGSVKDGDEILLTSEKFAQYVELKDVIENVDLLDYDKYEVFTKKVQKAIAPRLQKIEEKGSFLVKDIKYRQQRRKERSSIIPMPWKQLNKLTNAGGYARSSILVILDRAKKFKTGALVNIALRYMQFHRKNVLIIDLDNGEDEYLIRIEQCLANVTKAEVLDEDGDVDEKVRKILKRSKKHGGEVIVKRLPSLVTTANNISHYIDYLYREYGFHTDILIIDYIAKMGAISGKDSLHERISEAYIDISNLALEKGIDLVWTAQHVTREAAKMREKNIYESTDVAGAIDITRHVQAIFGLNRTKVEEDHGFQRLEVVDQRDGPPHGHVVFRVDTVKQKMFALREDELQSYYEKHRPKADSEETSYQSSKTRKKDIEDVE